MFSFWWFIFPVRFIWWTNKACHVLMPLLMICPIIVYYSAMKRARVLLGSPTRLPMSQSASRNGIKQTASSSHCQEIADVSMLSENVNTMSQSFLSLTSPFKRTHIHANILARHCSVITHSNKTWTRHDFAEMRVMMSVCYVIHTVHSYIIRLYDMFVWRPD